MKKTIAMAGALGALALPAAAEAHVTLQPETAPAGGFARLDVRVPNETEDTNTTKVEVKFPPGFAEVSTQPVPGWTAKVTKTKLAKPVTTDEGDKITEQVSTITWTGSGAAGQIAPGQFQDFGLSVALPDEPNKSLTFKALQTYDDGTVVRWIGAPGAEDPAPQVKLTAAEGEGHAEPAADVQAASTTGEDEKGAPTWLVVVALVLGAGGLAAGLAALSRRSA
jgi:periplasmic copper chaperone A